MPSKCQPQKTCFMKVYKRGNEWMNEWKNAQSVHHIGVLKIMLFDSAARGIIPQVKDCQRLSQKARSNWAHWLYWLQMEKTLCQKIFIAGTYGPDFKRSTFICWYEAVYRTSQHEGPCWRSQPERWQLPVSLVGIKGWGREVNCQGFKDVKVGKGGGGRIVRRCCFGLGAERRRRSWQGRLSLGDGWVWRETKKIQLAQGDLSFFYFCD